MTNYENNEGTSNLGQGMRDFPVFYPGADWGIEQAANLHQVGDVGGLAFDFPAEGGGVESPMLLGPGGLFLDGNAAVGL